MTNMYDCPTNFDSDSKVTPLEVDSNYKPYNDTPFNNMANPGCKATYRTPFYFQGCLILLGIICFGALFYGVLTFTYIQTKDLGVLYGFAFIVVFTGIFFCMIIWFPFYTSITIDPLHGKLTIRVIKIGCCCNSKTYELNNIKKIIVKSEGYSFNATMILQTNLVIDLLSGVSTKKNNERRKFVDILRKSLPNHVQLVGDLD